MTLTSCPDSHGASLQTDQRSTNCSPDRRTSHDVVEQAGCRGFRAGVSNTHKGETPENLVLEGPAVADGDRDSEDGTSSAVKVHNFQSDTTVKIPMPVSGSSSGCQVLKSFPDILLIPVLIFDGLICLLLVSAKGFYLMLQGWVLFVSICCFIVSSVLLLIFCLGRKMKSFWRKLGLLYHCLASPLYAVALILQIIATCGENERINSSSNPNMESNFKLYLDTAALIFCLIKVFLHFIYCVTLVAGI